MIWCDACARLVQAAEWVRVFRAVPVASRLSIVGHITVVKHRVCGRVTGVPVKA